MYRQGQACGINKSKIIFGADWHAVCCGTIHRTLRVWAKLIYWVVQVVDGCIPPEGGMTKCQAGGAPAKMSGEHPYSREAQDGYSEPRDCRASHTHTHTPHTN